MSFGLEEKEKQLMSLVKGSQQVYTYVSKMNVSISGPSTCLFEKEM